MSSPALQPGHVLRLTSEGGKTFRGLFRESRDGDWHLKVPAVELSRLHSGTKLAVEFSVADHLYNGGVQVRVIQQPRELLVISYPAELQSRPMRTAPRVAVSLPAALILSDAGEKPVFLGRDLSCVRNLSEGGALLVSKLPLPKGVERLMLVVGLEPDNPYSREQQCHIPARIVRMAMENREQAFPFAYGLQFQRLAPYTRAAINELLAGESSTS